MDEQPKAQNCTRDLQRLAHWWYHLARRRRKVEHLRQTAHRFETDIVQEMREWLAEAEKLADRKLPELLIELQQRARLEIGRPPEPPEAVQ